MGLRQYKYHSGGFVDQPGVVEPGEYVLDRGDMLQIGSNLPASAVPLAGQGSRDNAASVLDALRGGGGLDTREIMSIIDLLRNFRPQEPGPQQRPRIPLLAGGPPRG